MSDMHSRLREARLRAGYKSAAKAAEALGVGASMYRGHENSQNKYDTDQASHYARRFGVRLTWLLTGEEPASETSTSGPPEAATAIAPSPSERLPAPNASPPVPVDYPTNRIPIFGQAIAGDDGRFVLNGQRVMDLLCPPQLAGVPDAYGVFVHGDSMEPRYEAGEAVFVNPHMPVRQGNYVVVQIAGEFEGDDAAGYVKRFVSMNSRELVLEQFKPREGVGKDAPEAERFTLRFPRNRVVAVHKIVGSSDI